MMLRFIKYITRHRAHLQIYARVNINKWDAEKYSALKSVACRDKVFAFNSEKKHSSAAMTQ
jgi:hypothetical protein